MSPSVLQSEPLNSGPPTPAGEAPPTLDGAATNGAPVNGTNGANGTNGETNGTNGTHVNGEAEPEIIEEPTIPPKYAPVAIIGMACRLPGGASDPENFYQLVCRNRSGWSEIPEERFSKVGYHHPFPDKLGCYNPIGACFLQEDVGVFDAPFFNITEREAISMDPQHRIILECTYEAFENAGVPKHKIIGKDIGVYAGGSFTDYELNNMRDLDTQPAYQSTGNAPSLLSNRISYYFDLRGPSHTIETACSSSLTALHIAMKSLHVGDSEMVVLASSHLNLLPDHFVSMSSQGLLSPDGRSYAFDSRANGFGRGEGAGVLILKPLAQAQADGDNIRAIIVGSGVNQDGKTNGITMPNGEAQLALMQKVYAENHLDPRECGYVEAHGTGTKVGDPLEMTALHNMFHEDRTPQKPLYVGSVKSNVGHLEGASGVVSMIKSVLMLERQTVLPNYDFREGNPEIPFNEWGIKIPATLLKWPRGKKYISINSFGFGGGNAHCVLAAAPKRPHVRSTQVPRSTEPRRLYVVSAHSKESLAAQMENITIYLERRPVAFQGRLLQDLAFTLGQRRSFLPYKVAITGINGNTIISGFTNAPTNPVRSTRPPKIGFVFTGQGAQWHAMGRELMDEYPIFKASIERFDAHLKTLGASFSMMEELLKDKETSRLSDADLSQPGCTAIQLALCDQLSAWGIKPNAVVGHSSGEIAAAYAAGALSHEDCTAIAYFRGQSVLELKAKHKGLAGGMLAVGATPDEVWPLIKSLKQGKATIACYNSPGSITASGDDAAIEELAAKVEAKQQFNRRVRVDTAYHSHHMELVADWYGKSVGKLKASSKEGVAFHSSLKGHTIDTAELTTDYWIKNLTQPVRFSQALTDMCKPEQGKEPVDLLIELGPHSAMEGPVKQVLKEIEGLQKKPTYFSALIRNKDAVETTLELAGNCFTYGVLVDFEAVNFPVPPPKALKVLNDLPKYEWNHTTRYWWDSRIARNHLHRKFPRNDILGVLADYSNELEPTWRTIIRTDEMPWVRGHFFQDMIVYPMAGYLSMAVEAMAQRAQISSQNYDKFVFRDVSISRPLIINDGSDSEVNITLRPQAEGTKQSSKAWDEFRVFSWNKERNWVEHCRGLIHVELSTDSNQVHSSVAREQETLQARMKAVFAGVSESVSHEELYKELNGVTAVYNKQFQSMLNCKGSDTNCVADIVVPDVARTMPKEYEPEVHIHPAFLDQFTHAAWVILGAGRGKLPALYMPKFFKSLTISTKVPNHPGEKLRVFGKGNPNFEQPGSTAITMFATSLDGKEEMIHMEGLVVDPMMEAEVNLNASGPRELCFRSTWEAYPPVKEGEEALPNGVPAPADFTQDVVIVCTSQQQSSLAATVKKQFPSSNVTFASLADVDAAGKVAIVLSELDQPVIANMDEKTFTQVQKFGTTASKGVLWVVKGAYTEATNPQLGMIVGLARTIRSESPLKFATFDLDGVNQLSEDAAAEKIAQVAGYIFGKDAPSNPEMEFQERSGALSVAKVYDDFELNAYVEQNTNSSSDPFLQPFVQPGRPLKLHVGTKGALDTLHFIDDTIAATPLPADEISIEVKVTSMNFKDIMVSMGEVPSPYLGVECAGVVNAIGSAVTDLKVGDRVCASSEGAYATYARCKATSAARIPDDMSFEAGATMPVVFCTAYYGLFDIGRLQRGESILIHAAAGGVGQAAIMLSQMVGAEIYATVGSPAKKQFLVDTYGIAEERIFYSRDTTFAKAVQHATNGRGVDVVLNSLAGDQLRATWECMAHFGRFIEIGKRDILANSGLEMAVFEHNATFASVDLTVVASERPQQMKRILDDVFRLLGYGQIRPISPITTIPISDIEKAFRTLQAGKVHGKVLVTAGPNDLVKATYSEKTFDRLLRADATYLLIGGTGGIGRSLTKWMVRRGARNVVLSSRSSKVSSAVAEVIKDAKEFGANVVVKSCNVVNKEDVDSLVKQLSAELPPIRGVIHTAMVLDVSLLATE
jgi:acyl transferase domain-containing protein/NADPH:quinone reductase-like Zn-dependent oxidoreductase